MENDKEVKLTLRLPAGLHEEIQQIAKKLQRSLNSQIVYMLTCLVSDEAGNCDTYGRIEAKLREFADDNNSLW